MRDSTVLEPDSCAKKRRATIACAPPLAARASLPFECSADRPFAARSPFRRQRMAAVSAPPFEADGSAAVLAQAAVPATPFCCASVGRFSFGDSGAVLPRVLVPCWSTVVAGPTKPFVGSAVTAPPVEFCLGDGVVLLACLPPPPPQAARPMTAAIKAAAVTRCISEFSPVRGYPASAAWPRRCGHLTNEVGLPKLAQV